jgi:hypothetical protein
MFEPPRWLRDLKRFLPLKSQFVLTGTVRDLQACETSLGVVTPQGFNQTLASTLHQAGYGHVVLYDVVNGFQALLPPIAQDPAAGEGTLRALGLQPVDGKAPAGIDLLTATLLRLVREPGEPMGLIIDFASRLVVRQNSLTAAEHQLFTHALENSKTGLFAIGIECDAPRHELLEHARAREVWRPSVLRKAIPRIHRVSCHAWYHSPDGERSRLRDAIQASFHDESFA